MLFDCFVSVLFTAIHSGNRALLHECVINRFMMFYFYYVFLFPNPFCLFFPDLWSWTLAGEHAGSLSSLSSCWIMWRNCFRFIIGSIHYDGKAGRAAGAPPSFPLFAHLHSYKLCVVLQENMFSINFYSLFWNELHNGCMCLRVQNICPPSWFEKCLILLDFCIIL